MPKGYWIVRADITDQEQYKAYMAANVAPFRKYGARFLVRTGRFENPDGTSRTRNAVIELPTYNAAVDCWRSTECQEAIKLRQPVSKMDIVVTEGYESDWRHELEHCPHRLYGWRYGFQKKSEYMEIKSPLIERYLAT